MDPGWPYTCAKGHCQVRELPPRPFTLTYLRTALAWPAQDGICQRGRTLWDSERCVFQTEERQTDVYFRQKRAGSHGDILCEKDVWEVALCCRGNVATIGGGKIISFQRKSLPSPMLGTTCMQKHMQTSLNLRSALHFQWSEKQGKETFSSVLALRMTIKKTIIVVVIHV